MIKKITLTFCFLIIVLIQCQAQEEPSVMAEPVLSNEKEMTESSEEKTADIEEEESEEESESAKDENSETNEKVVVEESDSEEKEEPIPKEIIIKKEITLLRPKAFTLLKDDHEIDLSMTRLSSTSAWDEDGEKISFDSGGSFEMIDTTLKVTYGISDQFEFLGGGNFRQNTSQSDATGSVSASGLESVFLGFRYRLSAQNRLQKWVYAFKAQYGHELFSVQDYDPGAAPTDQMVLGDDGHWALLGADLSYRPSNDWGLNFELGLKKPQTGLSTESPYMAESFWTWENVLIGLGVRGIYSLRTDDDEEDPASRRDLATGQTYLFNSVNRSMTAPFLRGQFRLGNWSIGAEYAQYVRGRSIDQGTEIKVALTWARGGESQAARKYNQFKEYIIDATVIKTSPRGIFLKIDHGEAQDVQKGMAFDIYKTDYFGGNLLLAEARVFELGVDWAILKITKRFRDTPIEKGNAARAR